MATEVLRRHFTVDEYHRMVQTGILSEDDRVELIGGEIFRMTPIGNRHASCVKRLNHLLLRALGDKAVMSVQDPIALSDTSEPEPDLALLAPRDDFYADRHPNASDVLLLIEVADTSVDFDRNAKLPAYARAGIPEVWIVNLEGDQVEIYRNPAPDSYRESRQLKRGAEEPFSPQAFPALGLTVEQVLG